ncbi:sigma-70 family RNA polymerase sigma factor [Candidatus Sumerlaeota bacterium]|nr:sigma-70 family RNA polymerase sigma factor [Candidatus Sumerlaeota bacterium]
MKDVNRLMSDMQLSEWVGLAQKGDQQATDEIYRRFKDMAFSYAYSMLGDMELAEDARQEAFLQAYCDLVQLKDPEAFPLWFKQIVRSKSLALRRGRQAILIPLEDVPELEATGEAVAERLDRKRREQLVNRSIGQLPRAEREVVRLFYLEGCSMKAVEQRTGLAVKTVQSRLHSARVRLKDKVMGHVKGIVWQERLAGRSEALISASREAIKQFEEEIREVGMPSDAKQARACDLICAKGRLLRFMGEHTAALEAFHAGMEYPVLKRRPELRARFIVELGLTLMQTAEYARAVERFAEGLALLKKLKANDTELLRGFALGGMGFCAWHRGELERSRRYYSEMQAIGRKRKAPELCAESMNNLAALEWRAGKLAEAIRHFRTCLREWTKLGNRFGAAMARMNLGIIEENQGRLEPARKSYLEALSLSRELGFLQLQALSLVNLSSLALNEARFDAARERALESLDLMRKLGGAGESAALENLAAAELGLGNLEVAHKQLEQARKIAAQEQDPSRQLSLDLLELELRLTEAAGRWVGPRSSAKRSPKAGGEDWPEERLAHALIRELLSRMAAAEKQARQLHCDQELPRILRLRAMTKGAGGLYAAARKTLKRAINRADEQNNRIENERLKLFQAWLELK